MTLIALPPARAARHGRREIHGRRRSWRSWRRHRRIRRHHRPPRRSRGWHRPQPLPMFTFAVTPKLSTRCAIRYGTRTPWVANGKFGVVDATPSEPPSSSSICPTAHNARLPSATMPGVIASAVVTSEHVEPMVVLAVDVQGPWRRSSGPAGCPARSRRARRCPCRSAASAGSAEAGRCSPGRPPVAWRTSVIETVILTSASSAERRESRSIASSCTNPLAVGGGAVRVGRSHRHVRGRLRPAGCTTETRAPARACGSTRRTALNVGTSETRIGVAPLDRTYPALSAPL